MLSIVLNTGGIKIKHNSMKWGRHMINAMMYKHRTQLIRRLDIISPGKERLSRGDEA